jgi:hypothetical protein
MTTTIDTPLTRQKQKFEAELRIRDEEIDHLKIQIATVRGINDLLKFELASLESVLTTMQKNMVEVMEHVRILKLNLPNIEK